jgi:hypothetical protein
MVTNITLNNLSEREKSLAKLIWNIETKDKLMALMGCLSYADRVTVAGLTELIIAGGDDVADLQQAKEVIDKVKSL